MITSDATNNFSHLAIKDLVEARDLFHLHLINKKNVVATAIGRYRIRRDEPWPNQPDYRKNQQKKQKPPRTLENSEVRAYSWPAVLVFVSEWERDSDLLQEGRDNLVPSAIYMPDGRVVPICVIEAPKVTATNLDVDADQLVFPKNLIGGGFPVISTGQKQQRISSLGCLVSDGNKVYALTNNHVTGDAGTPHFTLMGGRAVEIGRSAVHKLGKTRFTTCYPEWPGSHVVVNSDVGLIDIDDLTQWKTDVYGIGALGQLLDLNTSSFSLDLLNAPVVAYGAVSGLVKGAVAALFYRYKSLGGQEYVADFLIGPRPDEPFSVHHGDSGTLWLAETKEGLQPFALQWGQHEFIDQQQVKNQSYALATNLSQICRLLDVDVVRGWNLDQDFSWGKTGHFKVGARSCELVGDVRLGRLLMANQRNIGFTDANLLNPSAPEDQFVPLADVADLVWRNSRPKDASNHFADMDESHPDVFGGQNLLQLCQNHANVDIDVWNDFYGQFEALDPERSTKRGALPFRVWQMYNQMVRSLRAGKVDEFICAGGTMAHYVGDASQPLHISFLHHGRNASEKDVHSEYETGMLDANKQALLAGIQAIGRKVKPADCITTGKGAALRVIELMHATHAHLPPLTVIEAYNEARGKRGKFKLMWDALGPKTVKNIANGCLVMAILWESAWREGGGAAIPDQQLEAVSRQRLMQLYKNAAFVPAFNLAEPAYKAALT